LVLVVLFFSCREELKKRRRRRKNLRAGADGAEQRLHGGRGRKGVEQSEEARRGEVGGNDGVSR